MGQPDAPALTPIVFSGHLLSPDPGFSTIEEGCPYFGEDPDWLRGVSWVTFDLDQAQPGWTFALDTPGLVASFPGTARPWKAWSWRVRRASPCAARRHPTSTSG